MFNKQRPARCRKCGAAGRRESVFSVSAYAQPLEAALTMTAKSGAFRDAPPMRPPSTSFLPVSYTHLKGEQFEELPVERFETHTRAFIKVEDGCNRQCAYCVIPRARGPVRSRSEESILAELRQLAASGYREVVLSAISLPSYGLARNGIETTEKDAKLNLYGLNYGEMDINPEGYTEFSDSKGCLLYTSFRHSLP